MTSDTTPRARRTPRPWPVRLVGWLVALVLVGTAAAVIINRGSFGHTTHEVAATPLKDDHAALAASVTPVHDFPADSYLVGPAVVTINDSGAVGHDPDSGEQAWRYTRTDTSVCAHHTEGTLVVLVYASGDRCDEAIGIDVRSGNRRWQRTIEATGKNTIVWNQGGFLSVDAAKMIAYENNQGYERFTLDNSVTDNIEGEHTSCENLAATGAHNVVTLQRCRATGNDPWALQLVVTTASDGDSREVGRSYLTGIDDPQLIDSLENGTAYVRDSAGTVRVYTAGAQDPTTVLGLPAMPEAVDVLSTRSGTVLSDGTTAFGLDNTGSHVAWSTPIVAAPTLLGNDLYLPTEGALQVRAADNGQPTRSIAAPLAPGTTEVAVSGPRIGVRTDAGLVVLR